MSLLLSDTFVADNPNIIVNIEIINQIESYFKLDTTESIRVSSTTSRLLFANNTLTKLINDIYAIVLSDSNYDPDALLANPAVNILDNASNTIYNSLDKTSFLTYLLDSYKLTTLSNEIEVNTYLQDNYKNIIKSTITKLLDDHSRKIKSALSTDSKLNMLTFAQIVPVFCVNKLNIFPFTQDDSAFWVFLNHSLYLSVNHILNNANSQLLLNEFNINNEIYINSINFALDKNIIYQEKHFFLTRHINEIMLYSIKNLLHFKKVVLLNGMSTYNITIGVILDLFVSRKDILFKIATYDNVDLFYPDNAIQNSVLFSNSRLFDL